MSEENKKLGEGETPEPVKDNGEIGAADANEPAGTEAIAGGEPAGADAAHPNQPQPQADEKPQAGEAADANAGESPQASGGEAPAAGAEASVDPEREAKLKAAAEARAARAAAKAAAEGGEAPAAAEAGADPEREAKRKAAAEARAARAAAKAAAEAGGSGEAGAGAPAADVDPEKAAKIKAAAEARAARAAAKAAAAGGGDAGAPAEPKPPSPKQPMLDEAVELLKTHVHAEAVEEASINELSGDMPTIVVKTEHWPAAAELLRTHERLRCNYLRNVSGIDYETHLEVVYYVIALDTKREYAIKVRTDRESASIPSATPVWPTANWNEREIYDLLGIDFPGHPDMRRIMMPDDWVGHPLRKDYVPLDPEV